MDLDVVISTRNNCSDKNYSLFYTLRTLMDLSIYNLNIYVADNGSTDDTSKRIIEDFGNSVTVIDSSHCKGNISKSRNEAAKIGRSEILVLLDDDVVINGRQSLIQAVQQIQYVDFACGATRFWAPLNWPNFIRQDDPTTKLLSTLNHISYEPIGVDRLTGRKILDHRTNIANFGVLKRSAFEALGGFDESYIGWGYQDTDLIYRLCIEKYKYEIFSNFGVSAFHLSHQVNKGTGYKENYVKFEEKQKKEGRVFHINHFFEVYEENGFSLFSDFSEAK